MINTTLPRSPGLIVMQYFNQIPHMNICAVITIYITCQSACRSNDVYEFAKNPRVGGCVCGGGIECAAIGTDATIFLAHISHTLCMSGVLTSCWVMSRMRSKVSSSK